jgi:chaperonin GroES
MATATKGKTSLKMLDDRVLVQPTEQESKTSAGIYLPDSAKEKPTHGKVVTVGPGKTNEDGKRTALSVKKGDTVIYGKYSGTEVDVDGETMVILRENELLAIIQK